MVKQKQWACFQVDMRLLNDISPVIFKAITCEALLSARSGSSRHSPAPRLASSTAQISATRGVHKQCCSKADANSSTSSFQMVPLKITRNQNECRKTSHLSTTLHPDLHPGESFLRHSNRFNRASQTARTSTSTVTCTVE